MAPLEKRAAEARRTGATEEAERLALDVLELTPAPGRALSILYEIAAPERLHALLGLARRRKPTATSPPR